MSCALRKLGEKFHVSSEFFMFSVFWNNGWIRPNKVQGFARLSSLLCQFSSRSTHKIIHFFFPSEKNLTFEFLKLMDVIWWVGNRGTVFNTFINFRARKIHSFFFLCSSFWNKFLGATLKDKRATRRWWDFLWCFFDSRSIVKLSNRTFNRLLHRL